MSSTTSLLISKLYNSYDEATLNIIKFSEE